MKTCRWYAGAVGLEAVAVGVLFVASPAHAQVAFGDPVAFIQSVARAAMVGAGAVMVLAGGYKGIQVWSGNRQLWDATTALLGGATLVFGTAAAVGFA